VSKLTEFQGLAPVTKTIEVLDSEEIGRQAIAVRKAAGLSRDQAAKDLGLKPNALYRLERGEQAWRPEVLDHFNEVAKGWVV
jgi:transcriptional regulator with XRE-family HTH domain